MLLTLTYPQNFHNTCNYLENPDFYPCVRIAIGTSIYSKKILYFHLVGVETHMQFDVQNFVLALFNWILKLTVI